MKKQIIYVLCALLLFITGVIVGMILKPEKIEYRLPFSITDVEYIEVCLEKDGKEEYELITDLERIVEIFESINYALISGDEPYEYQPVFAITVKFKLYLYDYTYDVRYESIGVKTSNLIYTNRDIVTELTTSSDLSDLWYKERL